MCEEGGIRELLSMMGAQVCVLTLAGGNRVVMCYLLSKSFLSEKSKHNLICSAVHAASKIFHQIYALFTLCPCNYISFRFTRQYTFLFSTITFWGLTALLWRKPFCIFPFSCYEMCYRETFFCLYLFIYLKAHGLLGCAVF